jgi:hypothetical protein
MTDIIVSSDSVATIGGPSNINLQVDFGAQGDRGSRIFSNPSEPDDFFTTEVIELLRPQVLDVFLDTRPEGGQVYQYQDNLGSKEWIPIATFIAGPVGPTGPTGQIGPTGPQGPTGEGLRVIGSFELITDLPSTENEIGDAYFVEEDGNIYTWDGDSWNNIGSLEGPQGEQGEPGEPGPIVPIEDLENVVITSPSTNQPLVFDGTNWINSDIFAPKFLTETAEKTANYTLAIGDINTVVLMNGTSLTLTVPTNASIAFPVGTIVNVYNANITDVTIVGASGVTVRNTGALAQYGEVSLRKRATDEWVLAGNVS